MKYLHTASVLFLSGTAFADPIMCPITDTTNSHVFVHGSSAPDRNGRVWFGTEQLAVLITVDGHWLITSAERNYSDKLWWWSEGYSAYDDPYPDMKVTARRLDGDAEDVNVDWTTNALYDEGDLMLNGLGFPTAGCWEVIGTYRDSSLTFVTLVGEQSEND